MEKKLGVLGGMGPQATLAFYQAVLNHTDAKSDQEHIQTVILSDSQIPDRTAAILSGDEEGVYRRLLMDARTLEGVGCTAIAVPCNTSHHFLPRVQQAISVPIIHMIDETVRFLAWEGHSRPAILATDGTLATGLYQTACRGAGMEGIAPPPHIQREVMSLIYDRIKAGQRGSQEDFAPIHQWVEESACDCAILACTELSTFACNNSLPPIYVDAMDVLAQRSVAICGGKLK